MRLGEILVSRGDISEEQLAKALNAQLIYGGHLGTCMIELGFLDEDTLGNLLADALKVRYAHRELLENIPPHVVAALSQAAVEKHRAIPFDLVQRTLHVAMVDPKNLVSLDELSFVSGYRIEAWVSPEVRIFQAMERYYEVSRRLRYISLARRLDEKKPAVRLAATMEAAAQDGGRPATVSPRPVPIEKPSIPAAPPGARGLDRLGPAAEELCRAENTDRVAEVILDHAVRGEERCLLFVVRSGEATIWSSRGFRLSDESAGRIRFAVTAEPLLELLSGESYYRGPVPAQERYRAFFEALKVPPPSEILLLPVYREDRIRALFYADGGAGGSIEGETVDFLRLMRKLILTLDLLVLKDKIHSA